MKRQFIFAMLILCFCSDSVFADLSLSFQEITGGSFTMLEFYYDEELGFGKSANASFLYTHIPPNAHDYLNEITYSDDAVSGRASAYYGYIYDADSFTINLSIDNWVKNMQSVDSLNYFTISSTLITCGWTIDVEPWEEVLMKVEIIEATWDGTDPYFSISCSNIGIDIPLDFKHVGEYYTTYLNSGTYHTSAELFAVLTNVDLTKNTQIYFTFEVVPVPSAFILGIIGLGCSSWRLRRKPE